MKKFSFSEINNLQKTVVELQKKGYSCPAIAKLLFPYCIDPPDNFARRIKTLYENYGKYPQRYEKAAKNMVDFSDEIIELDKNSKNPKKIIPDTDAVIADMTSQSIMQQPDGSQVSKKDYPKDSANQNMSPREKLIFHGFNPDEYELVSCRESRWNSVLDGEVIEMVSQSISVKPILSEDVYRDEFSQSMILGNKLYQEALETNQHIPLMNKSGSKVAILPLADYHLDKREPGAGSSFEKQTQEFLMIVEHFKREIEKDIDNIKRIIFFWSQDFFNYDYFSETTTSGTNKQDAQVGYAKMVQTGTWLLVRAIKELEKYAPVELFYTRSNHDEHTAFCAMNTLYHAFANDENVFIDSRSSKERNMVEDRIADKIIKGEPINSLALFNAFPRTYYRFGDCLFGFGHGDKENNRIMTVMQNEASRQFIAQYAITHDLDFEYVRRNVNFENKTPWDSTDVHVFFLGHFHSKQVKLDTAGVECIYLGTVMSGDKWHEDCGYTGARRDIEFYIYDEYGNCRTTRIRAKNLNMKGDFDNRPKCGKRG